LRSIKSTTVLDYHLVSGYEKLQQKLLSPKFADRLDKPLAFWALPADRHLPLALVGRTLQELLADPFEEIYGTPGIGPKKISTLLKLLSRASQPLPPGAIPPPQEELQDLEPVPTQVRGARSPIDVRNVSEVLWLTWRDGIRDYGLGDGTLGKYSSSLQRLPRVLWMTPLSVYLGLSLADIRQLKTHGEKRVRAVLEVFGTLHRIIVHLGSHADLAVRILPRNVAAMETWIAGALVRPAAPKPEEIDQKVFQPLVDQIRIDGGDQIAALVESRLKPAGATIQQTARRMGMTRARIYELLAEAPTLIGVRWPEGKFLIGTLRKHAGGHGAETESLNALDNAAAVIFGSRDDEADSDRDGPEAEA
jgi:hypothetical protein